MNAHYLLPEKPYVSLAQYHQIKGDALSQARKQSPKEILETLKSSQLRGRGGAGFPTGLKWQTLFEDPCEKKYIVVNGAEGEPGTFKDRIVLRKTPYALLEGVLIAAHVLGVSEIYICIKGSFHLELERVHSAIADFRASGLIEGINIYLVAGPEDYLFGEEKAMLNVIEGIGPLPREAHYPPYLKGLFSTPGSSNPALINNVETFARVPEIILKGAESFLAIGTKKTKGPFICTVSGDVKEEGIFEVTPGISLRELLHDYAKGPHTGREFKVILNGVSSAAITKEHLDVKLDYDEMSRIGSWLGSCSFIVYDDSRSAVRIAQEAARFLYEESCNQCPSCKGGLGVASNNINNFFGSEQNAYPIELIVNGAKSAPHENRCYLPVQGSIIIPSLVKAFHSEFQELADGKKEIPSPVVLPKIVDFMRRDSKFILKGEVQSHPTGKMPWEDDKFFINRQIYSR